jgi:hypothetical protein
VERFGFGCSDLCEAEQRFLLLFLEKEERGNVSDNYPTKIDPNLGCW